MRHDTPEMSQRHMSLRSELVEDNALWRAVQSRDPLADGKFVYAVRTTRIHCRPVCKARLARRANVEFFSTSIDAQKAGYRACKKCKPDQDCMPAAVGVKRAHDVLCHMSPETATTEEMAKQARLSKWHFHRLCKKITGLTPREYAEKRATGAIVTVKAQRDSTRQLRHGGSLLSNHTCYDKQTWSPFDVGYDVIEDVMDWLTSGDVVGGMTDADLKMLEEFVHLDKFDEQDR